MTPVTESAQPRRKGKKNSLTNGVSRFGNSAYLSSSPQNNNLAADAANVSNYKILANRGFGLLEGVV
jgi:hypothetical protein